MRGRHRCAWQVCFFFDANYLAIHAGKPKAFGSSILATPLSFSLTSSGWLNDFGGAYRGTPLSISVNPSVKAYCREGSRGFESSRSFESGEIDFDR